MLMLDMCNSLQMGWIATSTILATVMNVYSFGNRTMNHLIDQAMNFVTLVLNVNNAISAAQSALILMTSVLGIEANAPNCVVNRIWSLWHFVQDL